MLCSLVSWILFTFPLGSIQPEPVHCLSTNKSHMILFPPEGVGAQYRRKREIESEFESDQLPITVNELDWPESFNDLNYDDEEAYNPNELLVRKKRRIPKEPRGVSPYKINKLYINYDPEKMSNWVSPSFSNLVFKKDDVGKVRNSKILSAIPHSSHIEPFTPFHRFSSSY